MGNNDKTEIYQLYGNRKNKFFFLNFWTHVSDAGVGASVCPVASAFLRNDNRLDISKL